MGEELARNPKIAAKLKPLLPEGADIDAAAKGFKKLEDFATALHVAQNLKIAFSLVKAKMIAGEKTERVIRDLDPTVNAKAEARKAENQAKEDMKG